MGKIKILDSLTANQIAAGEVVERPVSVVKELVENSIDAGSTRIRITVRDGGIKRIQVSDNGCGMEPEDLKVAVQRHATSKIETVKDLNSLKTLGFRGEALPSIASVSKMRITTRTKGSPVGWVIEVSDGQASPAEETGCPIGTEITVDDLFYNTPARKKFLKSASSELGAISDMIGRLAMSQPGIGFEFIHENKILIKTPGNGDLAQVIFSIYGSDLARNMKFIKHEKFPGISGYVSLPQITRSSRHYYNFFLNGRFVKSQELTNCLEEIYHTRIPAKRYPVAVIHLRLDPGLFDVNVHPAKLEVKFKDPFFLKEALSKTILTAFSFPTISIPNISRARNGKREGPGEQKELCFPQESLKEDNSSYLPVSQAQCQEELKAEPITPFFSSLRVLGQFKGTYLIATGEDGLYIIDQHAAHERIRYEKIKKCYFEQPSAVNLLAVPVTIELTHQQTLWLVDHIVELADWGFILEHFGENTFLLRGVPQWHVEGNSQELLLDILEKLGNDKNYSIRDCLPEEKLFSMACKSAVKANRFLTTGDIQFLLYHLELADNPLTCPHGRPVLIKLTYEEIERRFFRT